MTQLIDFRLSVILIQLNVSFVSFLFELLEYIIMANHIVLVYLEYEIYITYANGPHYFI